MTDRPILLFPTPETADFKRKPVFFRKVHQPSHGRQGMRLSPMFAKLQATFNSRCAALQQTAAGVEPEQVLVIETIGNIENFAKAVKRIHEIGRASCRERV